jgi:hypothetical protein
MPENKPNHEVCHALIRHPKVGFGNVVLSINCQVNGVAYFVASFAPPQTLRSFETPDQARNFFQEILKAFGGYGWTIVHYGRPNVG